MVSGTFKGGIHPPQGKKRSMEKMIVDVNPSDELVFPLSQHIGAPAVPIVTPGDQVLMGQKIADAGGFVSSPVFSSVSGTVKSIEPRLVANGTRCNSIVIKNDGKYTLAEGIGTERNPETLSREEIIGIIKDSGIVGMGGAGFPTHVKVSPKNPDAIDTIIVNGAECEPYITCDYRLMLEQTERIVGGLKILLSLFPNAQGVIGVEMNKPKGIAALNAAASGESRISVQPLRTKYPQGGERSLIYAVTGRKINSSMLPADAGCIVDNISTVIAVYNAVVYSTPLIHRVFTVTGDAIHDPKNFDVLLGTSMETLIDAAGGFIEEPDKIISGGPMMGMALFSTDVPVTKTTSALTCFIGDMVAGNPETPCITCGRCIKACPSHLIPVMMMKAALKDDLSEFERLNGMECMECGSCAYVCPAKRPLTQAFKNMRVKVAAKRREEAAKK